MAENSHLSAQEESGVAVSAVSEENPGTVGGSGMIVGGNMEVCLKGGNAICKKSVIMRDIQQILRDLN
ncbi:MAG: hypothetical protein ACLUOI_20190 [Eisenbergiella sp.]